MKVLYHIIINLVRNILLDLRSILDLLRVSITSLIGSLELRDIYKRAAGLFPLNTAFTVLINDFVEDPSKLASSIGLLLQRLDLVLVPGLTDIAGVAHEGVVVSSAGAIVTGDGLVDPAGGFANISVDSWGSRLTTTNTPGDNTSLDKGVGVILGGTD